jgi:antitoxin StbD
METLLAKASIGIGALKRNPMATIDTSDGPVAILHLNKPVAYLIPASEWEAICDGLEDIELAEIVKSRAGEEVVSVRLEDLSTEIPQIRAQGLTVEEGAPF